MVESVTVFDEDFTEEDMAAALDWQTQERLTCSGCGFPLDETTDPRNDGRYDAEAIQCHGCAVRDRKERGYRDNKGDLSGVRFPVKELDPD